MGLGGTFFFSTTASVFASVKIALARAVSSTTTERLPAICADPGSTRFWTFETGIRDAVYARSITSFSESVRSVLRMPAPIHLNSCVWSALYCFWNCASAARKSRPPFS